MTVAEAAPTASGPVSVSPSAARRIAAILAREPAGAMLRVAVQGGGCSGFQYKFDIVRTRETDDLVLDAGGYSVLVDSVSVDYMAGSVIDFSDELIGAAFKIENPNATASCGCGTSFSL
jgi:iron-sulfur cluster assembly accessory protein